jgi:DNA repair protein RadC
MKYLKKLDIKLVKGEYKNPIKGQINTPEQVYDVFKDVKDRNQETLIGVYLDNELEVRAYDVLSLGSEKEALFSPIEVLEHAILLKSKYFILIHNHPSGDPTPTQEDKEVINDLKEKSKTMDRIFLDFIIVGDMDMNDGNRNYWSMFEEQDGGEYGLGSVN